MMTPMRLHCCDFRLIAVIKTALLFHENNKTQFVILKKKRDSKKRVFMLAAFLKSGICKMWAIRKVKRSTSGLNFLQYNKSALIEMSLALSCVRIPCRVVGKLSALSCPRMERKVQFAFFKF